VDELERRVTADGSVTLFSSRYGQTFHSRHGAAAESWHVFVEGSGVGARLRARLPTRVLEVGFGTGLNFFLTAQAALSSSPGHDPAMAAPRTSAGPSGAASASRPALEYVALERELLPADAVAGLGYQEFAELAARAYLRFRRTLPEQVEAGAHRAELAGAHLTLLIGEATEAEFGDRSFDAVYHDGFSPDSNPELWTSEFLGQLAAALAPGGVLVSYTVKGEVRRRLAAAGLLVGKEPGPPGGKRQMLRALRPG
jgi:tRNA U34 5-methylaminomethyl-2-thiouridine-forming methyltransferase MnmC